MRRQRHLPSICAIAEGQKDGVSCRVGVSLEWVPDGGMGGLTGVPMGIAAQMVLAGEIDHKGVLPPEQAVDPHRFFERFGPLSTTRRGAHVYRVER